MTRQEAEKLQELITSTHQRLKVAIKKIEQNHNDAWVIYLDFNKTQWYIWNTQDWLTYEGIHKKLLDRYSENGIQEATTKWRATMAAKKLQELTA